MALAFRKSVETGDLDGAIRRWRPTWCCIAR